MLVKCSTFDCTFSVTTVSRIADCTFPKAKFWGTFSLLFSKWDPAPQPAARALIPIPWIAFCLSRMNTLQYKQRINQRPSFPDSPQVCLLRLVWTVNRQTLHWSLESKWQTWFPAKLGLVREWSEYISNTEMHTIHIGNSLLNTSTAAQTCFNSNARWSVGSGFQWLASLQWLHK